MNDLTPVALFGEIQNSLVSDRIWSMEPLGHTPYQLKHFVIATADNPTDDTRLRQCIRELWGRRDAYFQNKYEQDKARAEIGVIEAERADKERVLGWLLPPSARCLKARRVLHQVEIDARKSRVEGLQMMMEQSIVREARVLLGEFNYYLERVPERKGDSDAVEQQNWEARARVNPKVKALLGGK